MKDMVFELDKSSKVKLYHQLYRIFIDMIESGDLPLGSKLPSIRTLSEDHNISRNTVTKAYSELEKDGYIYSLSKSGFYVKNPDEKFPVESPSQEPEKDEDNEIPTVTSLLKSISQDNKSQELVMTNMDATPDIHKTETIILKDPLSSDVFSDSAEIYAQEHSKRENNEVSFMMNSGDIVKSASINDDVIISPNEAFIDSCITALSEHHNRLEGVSNYDIQGEAPLRIAIAAFIYKFHRIDINPTQIALGSNIAYLIFHLLQLDQFRSPSKYLHGLLQLAENSISHEHIEPIAAVTEDIGEDIRSAFKASGFKVFVIDSPTAKEQIQQMEECKATVFFTSTRTIKAAKLTRDDQQLIFDWINAKEYRYLFEYDNSTEPHNYQKVDNYSIKEKVIYMNSFSNLISKSISTAFMFLPKHLVQSYRNKYESFESPLSMIEQCGLIDFLIKGKLYNYLTNLEQL